jgi:uncharacterized protein YyaL (SSP411 family)
MVADPELEKKAQKVIRAFGGTIRQFPSAYTQMLLALEFEAGPSHEVIIAGSPDASDTEEMLKNLRRPFLPNKVVLLRPQSEDVPQIVEIADYIKDYKSIDHKATAYVCKNFNCELPTEDPSKMLELLFAKNP